MNGEITIQELIIGKEEAVTDLVNQLTLVVATLLLFFVDMKAPMSMDGTISGMKK